VKLDPAQGLDYDQWVLGVRDGRSYCGDGLCHLFDFQINGFAVGQESQDAPASTMSVPAGQKLSVTVKTAALLDETPREDIRGRGLDQKPYWHVERARIGNSRKVPVELIVNGQSVETQEIVADGSIRDLQFEYVPPRSSWVALRVFPSCHTNPIFVLVDGKPIRASQRSAKWCLDAVDVCWNSKKGQIRDADQEAAQAAFDVARAAYRRILEESYNDMQ
jgi:hypothetical protein